MASDGRKRAQEYVTKDDISDIMNEMQKESAKDTEKVLKEAAASMEKNLMKTMTAALRKTDAAYCARFDRVEKEVSSLKEEMVILKETASRAQNDVTEVRRSVAMAESAVPVREALDLDDFERDPDPTIVRARTMDAVTPVDLLAGLKVIVDEMRLNDDALRVDGDELSRSFVVQFNGDRLLAARRAKKFMMSLKSNGEWRDLTAKTPDGKETKVFLDGDKSRKQIKREVLTRKLMKVLKDQYAMRDFRMRKRDGTVSSDLSPLARVIVTSPEDFRVEWNLALVAQDEIERDAVEKALKESVGSGDSGITWG